MEFRVLGPLEVLTGSTRVLLGPQYQKALAALLLADGNVMPMASLVDALWDGEPPASARHQVHKVIAILRSRLPGLIVSDGPGYRVSLDSVSLDSATFLRRAAGGTIPELPPRWRCGGDRHWPAWTAERCESPPPDSMIGGSLRPRR